MYDELCMKFEGDGDGSGGGGGGGEEHWLDQYDTLHENDGDKESFRKSLSKYGSDFEALKGSLEAQRKLGDPTRVPENIDNLSDEQRTQLTENVGKLHAKLNNVPDSEDGYEIDRTGFPEGAPYDEEGEQLVRAWGIKNKISQVAVQEAMNLWNQTMLKRSEANAKAEKKAADESFKELKSDKIWGKETERNLELIKRLLGHHAAILEIKQEDVIDALDAKGLGNHVPLARVLAAIAQEHIAEGKTFKGTPASKKERGFLDYSKVDE